MNSKHIFTVMFVVMLLTFSTNIVSAAWDDTKNTGSSLTAGEWNAQVTDQKLRILETLFDANSILKADSDNTPVKLSIAEQMVIGRITGGNITGLTAAQILTLISVESGATADQTKADIDALGIDANTLDSLDSLDFVKKDGTVTMTGDLNMGTKNILNIHNINFTGDSIAIES